jgi:S-disulfanyl-L-cysteine oxidoreductase SoxD
MNTFVSTLPILALSIGCASSTPPGNAPADTEPTNFAAQVEAGKALYGAQCAGCHGADGAGTAQGPRVVDLAKGALPLNPPATAMGRTGKFVTVADIARFVVETMPPGKAGSLTESEYYSILAFDLKANGVSLDRKLDGTLAATLKIPR